ncbi:hypothetical protein GCM10009090_38120 [[Pseudomonas] boreopolis]|uniref:Uncharacterized protein n=1 Tax=Xanthomonas boreopolis TaxID=86183 RepID=A0A919FDI3_9XANT|nr:hypothetical protein GCM10009090_38120 [[Pseudomonas] boreopolis]
MIVIQGGGNNAMDSKGIPEQLRAVLAGFLADPRFKGNLPKW